MDRLRTDNVQVGLILSRESTLTRGDRVRETRADILFVALGQPRGEQWLFAHCQALGVPCCVQVGASFDFVCGRVKKAPRWIAKIGMEWLYRTFREPVRMAPRYTRNLIFLVRSVAHDAVHYFTKKRKRNLHPR